MTKHDEIIEMAKDVGLLYHIPFPSDSGVVIALAQFKKLIEKRKCEELAKKIEAMPFGDTAASFAIWIRAQYDIEACASDPSQLRLRK